MQIFSSAGCITRPHLIKHVGRQADHGKVVNDENELEVNRFLVSHEARAGPHQTEVHHEDEGHRDRGVDQKPGVCPFVCNSGELYFVIELKHNAGEKDDLK